MEKMLISMPPGRYYERSHIMRKPIEIENTKIKSEVLPARREPVDAPKKEVVVTYALVDATAVNVRQHPSIEAESIDILKKGEKVQLGPKEGEFTFIFYGFDYHKAGYMMSKYLKEVN